MCRSLKNYVIDPCKILQREGIILLESHDENWWNQKQFINRQWRVTVQVTLLVGSVATHHMPHFISFLKWCKCLRIICDLVMWLYLLEIEYFMSYPNTLHKPFSSVNYIHVPFWTATAPVTFNKSIYESLHSVDILDDILSLFGMLLKEAGVCHPTPLMIHRLSSGFSDNVIFQRTEK